MKKTIQRTICLLLALVLCAGLLPTLGVSAKAASMAERQKAVVATALAYFDKGHSVQYGSGLMTADIDRAYGGKTRTTNYEAPEYATPNETLFSVCSDFASQIYWDAFHYELSGSPGVNWTSVLANVPADDPMTVYKYVKDENPNKTVDDAIHEMCQLLQPGDIVTAVYPNDVGGHTMVYVGDVFGNGDACLAHCFGASMDTNSGRDSREYALRDVAGRVYQIEEEVVYDDRYGISDWKDNNNGGIRLTPTAERYLQSAYGKGNETIVNALRPLNVMTEQEYPTRPNALYRVSHPRLSIDRIIEGKSRFHSTFKGDTLTLSITLKNASGSSYSVPVTEKIPQGVTVKKASDNAAISGDTVKWNSISLPAKSTKVLTIEYEVTAERGEQILFTDGSVGDIPSNTIPITVGGKKLTASEEQKLLDIADGKYDDALRAYGVKDATLGQAVYKSVLGIDVQLPELKDVVKNYTYTTEVGKITVHVFKDSAETIKADALQGYQMLVPTLHGGQKCWNQWGHERCNDPRDMHLEPGDIIVRAQNPAKPTKTDTLLYLGEGKYLKYGTANKPTKIVDEPEFVKSLLQGIFYCLRPTLAYDDVHVAAAPKTMKFTDVKSGDWFYDFVKELYEAGVISGMTETTFAPKGTLKYGQAIKLLVCAMDQDVGNATSGHWASNYLAAAQSKGWISGTVNLDADISRQAFCQIAAKAKGLTEQPESNPFTDTADTAVLALNKAGVINGMTATTFVPDATLNREQISKIISLLRKV